MSLSGLLPLLGETEQFAALLNSLRPPRARAAAIAPDPATEYVVAALWRESDAPMFVLTPNPESARKLHDRLFTWLGDDAPIFHFAESEDIPFERYVPDLGASHQRLQALAALRGEIKGVKKPLVVASIRAATQATLERAAFDSSTHLLSVRDRINLEAQVRQWLDMGYSHEPTVEIPGTISRRGGILDIFPVSRDRPVRIELFDDEIETIRHFDPGTQRSTGKIRSITIPPARETLPRLASEDRVQELLGAMELIGTSEEAQRRIPSDLSQMLAGESLDEVSFYAGFFNLGNIFDYLSAESLMVVLRPGAIEEMSRSLDRRLVQLRSAKEKRGDVPAGFAQPHIEWGFISDAMNARPKSVNLSPWGVDSELPGGSLGLPINPSALVGGGVEKALELIKNGVAEKKRTVVITNHAQRFHELAHEQEIETVLAKTLAVAPEQGEVQIVTGHLLNGFSIDTADGSTVSVMSDAEVFGIQKERRRIRKRPIRKGPALEQLKPGSYVVHIEHGVARFVGTKVMGSEGQEYLVLEYAEDDKLYVPTDHLDRIQLYHGTADAAPKLTRLGTQEWNKARARAKRATEQLAGELIALYASRQVATGFAASADTPWQDSLEASFPYEETPDQLTTIEAVKADMESSSPMDRLVCGDVGYGKTEIALRAAFKAVQSGRQVAILVPTTVLAQQHLETFTDRLEPFPVAVEMLSRFRSDRQQKEIIVKIADGSVDIVIGTHRLLQKDVRFKDLGLVIIDEEHKFGVSHKERLKQLRTQVDVMTLSATPIPRTLHMSLAGVRDMSTIETPPEERLPIKTYVSEDSDDLVREAILRELDRGGQVFYLHNRVKNIELVANKIQKLVPEANLQIGHGQMPEDDLERVMAEFERGEFNVLLCTTIIESGLDLPNANTLIIDRADMFGLSQLYQLRGRIGRGANRAYAYLMVPRAKQLTEQAEQRLNTILAATELGAGFQIALRDLEIRGIGNLLGAEQSGQISAIGFDLYTKLLAEAVRQLKEADSSDNTATPPVREFSTVRVDIGIDARIPDSYIEDLAQRLSIYQRLARIRVESEIDDLDEEIRDRFGPMPTHVKLLMKMARMRSMAVQAGVELVAAKETRATLTLKEPTGGARAPLQKQLGTGVDVGHMQIRVEIDRDDPEWIDELMAVLDQLKMFQERIAQMMEMVMAAERGDETVIAAVSETVG
ncbi:MAG: transcription-repair coupling factor [SAR202 cluster bacterium]|nr:transcription-repair coupling factor [Dehalococcoidia bacterium]MQG30308.1 transcription-repair coupling factor [SAR202 cluster bacterium]